MVIALKSAGVVEALEVAPGITAQILGLSNDLLIDKYGHKATGYNCLVV